MRPLFECTTYKPYLKQALDALAKDRRGIRSRLAEAIGCRPGYVTQVLEGDADLSPDQATLASGFLGLTEEESEYFLLLVMEARAGTPQLRSLLERQIRKHRERYTDLKNRLKVETVISPADEAVIYSSWHHLAVLTLIAVPGFQTKEKISERLGLSLKRASEVLDQLHSAGLVLQKGARYTYGQKRTFLSKDSPHVAKHHLNWRLQAMQAIERKREGDFHYSSVVSLSTSDRVLVKAALVRALEEVSGIVAPSKEESVCTLCLDFFEL